jgi:soluble lytic murein transglycosylase-like protein
MLLALLGVPMLAALAHEPADDPTIAIEPVTVRLDREEIARRQEIARAVREYEIERGLAADIHDIAREEGIPPRIGFALVRVESEFDERAESVAGARGLTQVMPATARYLEPGLGNDDLFDRETNLRLGFRYLRMMLERFDHDLRLALLAYNRGPGTVNRQLAQGLDPGNGFASRVLAAKTSQAAAAE